MFWHDFGKTLAWPVFSNTLKGDSANVQFDIQAKNSKSLQACYCSDQNGRTTKRCPSAQSTVFGLRFHPDLHPLLGTCRSGGAQNQPRRTRLGTATHFLRATPAGPHSP